MAYWIREYSCGCIPDGEYFCKNAEERVWEERDALQVWALEDIYGRKAVIRAQAAANNARSWLVSHYKEQEEAGRFTDVNLSAFEPPDDFDEDPRVVGYG